MKRFVSLSAIFTILLSIGVACGPTPGGDTSAATGIATQATAEATRMDRVPSPEPPVSEASPAPATATRVPAPAASPPPMPSPEICAEEGERVWHWLMGHDSIADFSFPSSSVGFAIGTSGTLLRTDDGGSSWRAWPIRSPYPLNAIYLSNEERGWVAGNGGTLLQTTDGGLTWLSQHTGTQADLLSIGFLDDKTGWVGGTNGTLLHTLDGGADWSATTIGPQISIVDVAFVSPQEGYLVGYVGGQPLGYVMHSTAGGASWETVSEPTVPEAIYATEGMPPVIVGGWVGGSIWRGTGHTSTTLVVGNLGQDHFRDVLFADAERGWAVGGNSLALYTLDGGEYWQSMAVHKDANWTMLRLTPGGQVVLAGDSLADGIQVVHSPDRGASWVPVVPGGSPTWAMTMFSVDFVDPWFGWAVMAKGIPSLSPRSIFTTRDGGQSWEEHDVLGGGMREVHFVDRLRGWAIGEGGLVARTDDGGQSWELQSIAFAEELRAISFVDREHGWVLSDALGPGTCHPYTATGETHLTLFRTVSGGDEWEGPICIEAPSTYVTMPQTPPSLQFVDPETGWIAHTGGVILKTTNGGLDWQVQAGGAAVDLTDMHFADPQAGWVVGDNGVLLQTTDGGAHWKQQRVGKDRLTGVHFVSRETGWVTSPREVFFTSDSGGTWETVATPGWTITTLDAVDEPRVWVGMECGRLITYAPVCLSLP